MSDLKEELKGIHVQLAKYNTLLEEHIKRTAMLEARFIPVEEHVVFIRKLFDGAKYLVGFLAAVLTIYKLFR